MLKDAEKAEQLQRELARAAEEQRKKREQLANAYSAANIRQAAIIDNINIENDLIAKSLADKKRALRQQLEGTQKKGK